MTHNILIAGGGLSGLCCAWQLQQQGIEFTLVEARQRLGGRILSAALPDTRERIGTLPARVDLGPSWFWPGQLGMGALVDELGLSDSVFEQFSTGHSVMEYADGRREVGRGSASMAGSWRLDGGMQRLIDALASRLPAASIMTGTSLTEVILDPSGLQCMLRAEGQSLPKDAAQLVLALPPRVVASTMTFSPDFSHTDKQTLQAVPTWMAGQAKLVVTYPTAFWREQGLSGDAMSQRGPLVEIHDASPPEGERFALFGFVGVPPAHRQGQDDALIDAAVAQLVRLFGAAAETPDQLHYQDWAFDEWTATAHDRQSPQGHASGHLPALSIDDARLVWAGAETARGAGQSNGYLEGAVESAHRAARQVIGGLPQHGGRAE